MATSSPAAITHICNRIIRLEPSSILDVGIGFGKYGFLAREYTDIYKGRYHRNEWIINIDGIEGFEKLVTKFHYQIYDNVYIGNACDLIDTLDNYDLIMCIDMLEHVEKDKGKLLLETFKNKSKTAIISIPIKPSRQGRGKYDNPFAPHRAIWSEEELSEFGNVIRIKDYNKVKDYVDLFFLLEVV